MQSLAICANMGEIGAFASTNAPIDLRLSFTSGSSRQQPPYTLALYIAQRLKLTN